MLMSHLGEGFFFIYFYLSLPFLSFYMRVSVLLFSLYCTWFDIQCNAGVGGYLIIGSR